MTYQEILEAVPQLSMQERLSLLEVFARSVRAEIAPPDAPLSEQLYGILDRGARTPTDDELREDCTDYLIWKYA